MTDRLHALAAPSRLLHFCQMDRLQARVAKLARVLEVAKALVAERDLDRLLKLIVQAAARVVEADRCSLFLVDKSKGELWSKIAQGVGTREIRFPMGKGIAGTVAETNAAINIPDAYDDARFNPEVDKETGYRTKSILCVPMRSLEGEVVGVLQALNKVSGDSFTDEDEELLSTLGGQAAVAVNNAFVNQEIAQLFEGFVQASVVAIESRDPTTAGHSDRVAHLSVGLADVLPAAGHTAGRWKDSRLSAEERQELRYAALLHDFGKVGVRENVLVKANKLEPGELETLRARFEVVLAHAELEAEKRKVKLLMQRPKDAARVVAEEDARLVQRRRELEAMFQFILACNRPTILEEGTFDRLFEIAHVKYVSPVSKEVQPFLTQGEILKLSIRKGSLTEIERREIESHVTHTYRFLQQIPWTRALRRVPEIAYGHHEKLGGGGYPRALKDPEIALATRMMTISDIYDALTASDRPYKKAVPKDKAYQILEDEARRGDIDADLLRVFIDADVPARAKAEEQ
jgi:HD-GYP domain-containing protein (c-di-GMP phosphodiesterase class II)